jgi:hypothetical protein
MSHMRMYTSAQGTMDAMLTSKGDVWVSGSS